MSELLRREVRFPAKESAPLFELTKRQKDMKRNTYRIAAALAAALVAVCACKRGPEMTEAERFQSGLTAADTAQMLKLCDDCMSALKEGRAEDALKNVWAADSAGETAPLTQEQAQALRNTFRMFPVIDYKLAGFRFSTAGLNEVKYEIKFTEGEEGSAPNTIAFMFNPVKSGGQWRLAVKQGDQKVLGE